MSDDEWGLSINNKLIEIDTKLLYLIKYVIFH